jgi:hypothetical protein
VINARRDLKSVCDYLLRRLEAVDKTLFGQSRMSETRARYLVSDPAHLDGAQRWELQALSALLDVSYHRLAGTVFRFDTGRTRAQPSHTSAMQPDRQDQSDRRGRRSDTRGGFRGSPVGVLTELEWEAFRAAPELLPTWDHVKGFALLDEYIQSVSPKLTAARGKRRTDAREWTSAYIERYGG